MARQEGAAATEELEQARMVRVRLEKEKKFLAEEVIWCLVWTVVCECVYIHTYGCASRHRFSHPINTCHPPPQNKIHTHIYYIYIYILYAKIQAQALRKEMLLRGEDTSTSGSGSGGGGNGNAGARANSVAAAAASSLSSAAGRCVRACLCVCVGRDCGWYACTNQTDGHYTRT